ncbi:SMP-30/gluconolactonase/LRE family protein [Cellvibrio polysaccharolyticus]|nr:GTP-binding protein [Cellvibrio polysaccharolyticus]
MKKWLSGIALMTAISAHAATEASHQLEQVWFTEGLRTPESVLVHGSGDAKILFVSEIEGQGADADGKGGVAKMSPDGKILNQDWVRGLNAPKGLGIFNDKLYVADLTEVVEIALDSGKILRKIAVADSVFLNDIAISTQGEVFVSDTRTNKVHRIVDGKAELWLDNVTSANGLKVIDDQLIIGAGEQLLSVDREKNITVLAKGFASGIDGVEPVADGEFVVTCWVGLVYYVHADGRLEQLIDSREEKINTADLGYDPDTGIVYIPNFFKDSVTAYRLVKSGS